MLYSNRLHVLFIDFFRDIHAAIAKFLRYFGNIAKFLRYFGDIAKFSGYPEVSYLVMGLPADRIDK